MHLICDKSGSNRGAVKPVQEKGSEMTANDLMIVIRARDEAAKALASVQGQLGLIVEAAQAANEAMVQIAETAAPAMAAAKEAVAAT